MKKLKNYLGPRTVRTFDIEAISIPIVYNKYGYHDTNGLIFVLRKDSSKIQKMAKKHLEMSPPQHYKEVQPLVIRANVSYEICINLYNKLNRRVSLHVQGLKYDVQTSDGANVGYNRDITTDNVAHYTYYAEKEGIYFFSDMQIQEAMN